MNEDNRFSGVCPTCGQHYHEDNPNLGLATTGELINELRARCEVNGTINYKTVDDK